MAASCTTAWLSVRQPESAATHSMLGLSTYVLRIRFSCSGFTIALLMGAEAAMQRGSASVLPRLKSLICFSCPAEAAASGTSCAANGGLLFSGACQAQPAAIVLSQTIRGQQLTAGAFMLLAPSAQHAQRQSVMASEWSAHRGSTMAQATARPGHATCISALIAQSESMLLSAFWV